MEITRLACTWAHTRVRIHILHTHRAYTCTAHTQNSLLLFPSVCNTDHFSCDWSLTRAHTHAYRETQRERMSFAPSLGDFGSDTMLSQWWTDRTEEFFTICFYKISQKWECFISPEANTQEDFFLPGMNFFISCRNSTSKGCEHSS